MEYKYSQFLRFDWGANSQYQHYLDNIFPTPPLSRMERFKHRWFRDNIDPGFDVDYNPPTEEQKHQN